MGTPIFGFKTEVLPNATYPIQVAIYRNDNCTVQATSFGIPVVIGCLGTKQAGGPSRKERASSLSGGRQSRQTR